MMRQLMRLLCTGAAGMALTCAAMAQSPASVPIEAFFSRPDFADAKISPTGRHVALASRGKDGHLQLVVLDTATLSATVVASFTTGDVANVHWASDKRLVYGASDPERETPGIPIGVYAVNADGSDWQQWVGVRGSHAGSVSYMNTAFAATTWMQDSDDIFIVQPKLNHLDVDVRLARVSTREPGEHVFVPPDNAIAWAMGPGDVPHFVVSREDNGRATVYTRDGDGWTKVNTFSRIIGGTFLPVGYAADGTVYVARRAEGSDNVALYTLDPKSLKFSAEPIISAKGFDLLPIVIRSRDKVLGVRITTDATTTYWFDPEMKKLQAKVDALMPGTVNLIDVPLRAEVSNVLIFSYSDVDPGQYYLYDTKTDKVVHVGHFKKAIDPKLMGQRDFMRIKARDGLEIPVWVTKPKGATGPMPAVVLVHGGPWLRGGSWRWSAESEFLASRGYVVIEPEYRGSVGYGFKWFRAGWKQWGLAMQNDIADATKWAIEKGIVDAKRICIGGASYGGYATLMGLANDPDLYRCGFEWIGITDIDLMYSISWSDASDEYKTFGMPVLVADREKDAAQIRATSPIAQASKIKQPLLMGYGGADRRVPIQHGRDFRDAVQKTNQNVEWVVYLDEGHGWVQRKTNIDWWTRVEKFLAKNIGQ